MKIFSLETKKHLVGWSLGLGFIIGFLFNIISYSSTCGDFNDAGGKMTYYACRTSGFPLHNNQPMYSKLVLQEQSNYSTAHLNLIFWILIAVVILSLIRHFKYRKA